MKYFQTFKEFKKSKNKELFFDFEEIKAKRIKTTFENDNAKLPSAKIKSLDFYLDKNAYEKYKNAKQVVIKNISNLDKKGFYNALNYVVRHSESLDCINDNNKRVEANELIKEWEKDFGKKGKEVWHLVFSINEEYSETKRVILFQSVQATMQKNFFGYDYVLVQHSHQSNPHIHVLLKKRNTFTGKKLHFNNQDELRELFNTLKNDFATSLNRRGLNYRNFSSLDRDLKKELESLKDINYESKVSLFQTLSVEQKNIDKKLTNIYNQSAKIKANLKELIQEKNKILNEALEAQMNNNKIYFQKFKEVKAYNEKIKYLLKTHRNFKTEYENLKKQNLKLDTFINTSLNTQGYSTLEEKKKYLEFVEKNYTKKFLTKKQKEMIECFKREIQLKENALNENLKEYLQTTIALNALSLKGYNSFALAKKLKELKRIEALVFKQFDKMPENIFDELYFKSASNQKVIKEILEKRYQALSKKLQNNQTKELNNFLLKEYEMLFSVLGKDKKEKQETPKKQNVWTQTQEQNLNNAIQKPTKDL